MTNDEIIGLLSDLTAQAEGYPRPGTLPWKQKNPGDLTAAPNSTPTPDGKVQFVLHSTGWAMLERQWRLMLAGNDPEYPAAQTWADLSARYSGQPYPNPWGQFITSELGVNPQSAVADWLAGHQDPGQPHF